MNETLLQINPETLTIEQTRELANDALRDIATALISHADHDHWGDDCGDYLNAATDQLSFLTHLLLTDQTDEVIAGTMRWLLTASRDHIDSNIYPSELDSMYIKETTPQGFFYGYCDHPTAISSLMSANKED